METTTIKKIFSRLKAVWITYTPPDFYVAVVVLLCVLFGRIMTDVSYYVYSRILQVLLIVLLLGCCGLLIFSCIVLLRRRVKEPQWQKKTLLYLTGRGLGTLFLSLKEIASQGLASIPLPLRLTLGYCVAAGMIIYLSYTRHFVRLVFLLTICGAVTLYFGFALRKLEKAGEQLGRGDFSRRINKDFLVLGFKRYADTLRTISTGMNIAVEERLKSERLKTELITNVSHDIKTPLTSIINYVDLLQKNPDPVQAEAYLAILEKQSKKLKKLTEDLVEISKVSSGVLEVNAAPYSIHEFLRQAVGEYSDLLENARIETVLSLPEEELIAYVDGTLLWRVVDNLFINAGKYAMPGTRFYVEAEKTDGKIRMTFKNVSRDRLGVPAEELMERFVRGDRARGGEGSGLGLNIAKSLTELMDGTFLLTVDGDLFKVTILLPEGEKLFLTEPEAGMTESRYEEEEEPRLPDLSYGKEKL